MNISNKQPFKITVKVSIQLIFHQNLPHWAEIQISHQKQQNIFPFNTVLSNNIVNIYRSIYGCINQLFEQNEHSIIFFCYDDAMFMRQGWAAWEMDVKRKRWRLELDKIESLRKLHLLIFCNNKKTVLI